jgi:MscS family membrane protein
LPQTGVDLRLRVTLVQRQDGHWRIAAPAEDELAASYRVLPKRNGGREPTPDSMQALRTPRDTMHSVVDAMQHWDSGGMRRVLDTVDLSQIRPGYRVDQGPIQAQYMMQVINRIGLFQWQEIPDGPASREPLVSFDHGAGRIVIAPQGEGDHTRWRFTAETGAAQLRLFVVTEDMPPVWGMPVLVPPGGLFAMRRQITSVSPWLLARSASFAFENWQIIAFFSLLLIAVFAVVLLVPLVISLVGLLLRSLGLTADEDLGRRLV